MKINRSGILITYKCNAACRHCLYMSNPGKGSLMAVDDARRYFAEFAKLGLKGDRIHIAGGEPFMYYDRLLDIVKAAGDASMSPLLMVETNGFWCSSTELAMERFEEIKRAGMRRVFFSADVYHQEFVSVERVRIGIAAAKAVFGEDNVPVRHQHSVDDPQDVSHIPDTVRKSRERVAGRAAEALAQYLEHKPVESFAHLNCERELHPHQMEQVHLDPDGLVFPSKCAGIIFINARERSLSEAVKSGEYAHNPIMEILARKGPVGLLSLAEKHGYVPESEYVSKCHLCYETRKALLQDYPEFLGPEAVYVE
ncbi:radical SAM protein [Candidatus Poribacteria bacterium]